MKFKYDNTGANRICIQTEDGKKVSKFYGVLSDNPHNFMKDNIIFSSQGKDQATRLVWYLVVRKKHETDNQPFIPFNCII